MYKKILFFVIFLISITGSIYATNVELTAHVYSEDTIFNYIFTFGENDSYSKFSFEIPSDATIDYVVDENGPISYSVAGNYLILNPDDDEKTGENVFLLKYKTKSISEEIKSTESFRSYQNFNFPVNNFKFNVILKNSFGEIISVFPANYTTPDYNNFEWNQKNLEKNSLYVINFKQENLSNQPNNNLTFYITLGLVVLVFIILFIIMFFIYLRYLKKYLKKETHKKSNNKDKINDDETENITEITISNNKIANNKNNILNNNNDEDNKNSFENNELLKSEIEQKQDKDLNKTNIEKNKKITEIIEKHLTENEKSVVELIKEKEGISQHDILDYLPSLTKSNLSKIISKLHTKRILKRIKVGKINNIYLGEKINPEESSKKSDEEEEF